MTMFYIIGGFSLYAHAFNVSKLPFQRSYMAYFSGIKQDNPIIQVNERYARIA